MTTPAATGTHLTAANGSNARHVTNPPAKATVTVVEPDVVKNVDALHADFLQHHDENLAAVADPEWCAQRFIGQWVDALRAKNPEAYEIDQTPYSDYHFKLTEMGKAADQIDEMAVALCKAMWTADYVAAIKAMGVAGLDKYSEHVQGLSETKSGRQWLHMQIAATPGLVLDDPDGSLAASDPNAQTVSFADEEYDPALSVFAFADSLEQTDAWLKAIAPRKGVAVPEGEPAEAEDAWLENAEKAIDTSYFSTYAEFAAVTFEGKSEEILEKTVKRLGPRLGLSKRASVMTKDEVEALMKKFRDGKLLVGVPASKITEARLREVDITKEEMEVFDKTAEGWKTAGETVETVAQVLVVYNSAASLYAFISDPNVKNGIGAASAVDSILQLTLPGLVDMVRKGRMTEEQLAAKGILESAAKEAAENAAKTAAEGGGLRFLASDVMAKSGGKLVPVLGVIQGVLDTVSALFDLVEAAKDGNAGGVVGAATVATGGILITVGSLMFLTGAGAGATIAGLPAAAVLFIIGTILEFVGALIETFFPNRSDMQKWVLRTFLGNSPSGTLQEQIAALNEVVYTPTIALSYDAGAGQGEDSTAHTVTITCKLPGLDDKSSAIPAFTMTIKQGAVMLPFVYVPLEDKKDYGSMPAPTLNFSKEGSLDSVVFSWDAQSQDELSVDLNATIDPSSDGSLITVKVSSAPLSFG